MWVIFKIKKGHGVDLGKTHTGGLAGSEVTNNPAAPGKGARGAGQSQGQCQTVRQPSAALRPLDGLQRPGGGW